eukprot:GHVP01039263.1.p1 GENE.GHVP01039263.1~~GHVP01039263.1.p1  ORF type:complete len:207 (+),score=38.54 GHVP01039263.1:268-888(+)
MRIFLPAIFALAEPEKVVENAFQGALESKISQASISQSIHSALQEFVSHVVAVGKPGKFTDVAPLIEEFIEILQKPFTKEEFVPDCGIELEPGLLRLFVPGLPDLTCRQSCLLQGGCYCHEQGQLQIDTEFGSCECVASGPPFLVGSEQEYLGTVFSPDSPKGCVYNFPPVLAYYNEISKGPVGCDAKAPIPDPEFVKGCLCECPN